MATQAGAGRQVSRGRRGVLTCPQGGGGASGSGDTRTRALRSLQVPSEGPWRTGSHVAGLWGALLTLKPQGAPPGLAPARIPSALPSPELLQGRDREASRCRIPWDSPGVHTERPSSRETSTGEGAGPAEMVEVKAPSPRTGEEGVKKTEQQGYGDGCAPRAAHSTPWVHSWPSLQLPF